MRKTGLPDFWVDAVICRVTIRVKNTLEIVPKDGARDLCRPVPVDMEKSEIRIAAIPDKMIYAILPPVRLIGM